MVTFSPEDFEILKGLVEALKYNIETDDMNGSETLLNAVEGMLNKAEKAFTDEMSTSSTEFTPTSHTHYINSTKER